MSTPYISDFMISGNKIVKNSPFNKFYSQVVLNDSVPKVGKFTFKWKITKSHYKQSSIFFGITPIEFKNYRTSHFSPKSFSVLSHKNWVFPNRRQTPITYGSGDIIEIVVDNS